MLAFTLYSHLSPGMRRSFQPTLRCRRRYHTVALTENARRGGRVAGFVENLTSLYGSAAAAIKTRRGVDRSAMKRINLHRCRSLYRAAALRGRAATTISRQCRPTVVIFAADRRLACHKSLSLRADVSAVAYLPGQWSPTTTR